MDETPLKILLVDDKQEEYVFIQTLLRASKHLSFQLEWAVTYEEGLGIMQRREHEVYLIDYRLNREYNGLDLVGEALGSDHGKTVILLTAYDSPEIDAAALKAGVTDYLEKTNLTASLLSRTIRYGAEHQRLLNNLKQSEERHRIISNIVTDYASSFRVEPDGTLIHEWGIGAIERILGYDWAEGAKIPGFENHKKDTPFLEYHPEDRAQVEAAVEKTLRGEANDGEYRMLTKEGGFRWVHVYRYPVWDEVEKRVVRYYSVDEDIHERKLAEEALRKSEARNRVLVEAIPDLMFVMDADGTYLDYKPVKASEFYAPPEVFMGKKIKDVLPAGAAEAQMQAVEQVLKTGAIQTVEYELPVNGIDKHYEARIARYEDKEVVAVVRDITQRKEAEAAEREQRTLAEALRDTAAALNTTLNFNEVLDRILANVGKVVPAESANIMLIENGMASIARFKDDTPEHFEELIRNVKLVVTETPSLLKMIVSGQPLIISDVREYADWVKSSQGEGNWIRSYAAIPIQLQNQVIGFLNLNSTQPNFFTPKLVNRLKVFSDQIGTAVQNARAYEQAQELAGMQERQRLASDLHDSVSQTLFGLQLIARSLPNVAQDLSEESRTLMNELGDLSVQAYNEIRTLVMELRPKALEESSVGGLLNQLVQTFNSRYKTKAALEIEGLFEVDAKTKVAVYRIAQEALNNIAKHAHARQVSLKLKEQGGGWELVVSDDGRGFDQNGVESGHFGLKIMKERCEAIGARFIINSPLGTGTTITVTKSDPS